MNISYQNNIVERFLWLLFGLAIVLLDNKKFLLIGNAIYAVCFLFLYFNLLKGKVFIFRKIYVLPLSYSFLLILSVFINAGGDGSLTSILLSILFFSLLYYSIETTRINVPLQIYIGVSLGLFVNAIILLFGVDISGIELYENYRFAGTLEKSTALASVINFWLIASIIFYKNNVFRKMIIFFSLAILALVVFSGSKKVLLPYLMYLVSILILLIKGIDFNNKKNIIWSLALVVITSLFFNFSQKSNLDHDIGNYSSERALEKIYSRVMVFINQGSDDVSTQDRYALIGDSIDFLSDHMFFGGGQNAILHHLGSYAHNDILDLLGSSGLFVGLSWLFMYISFLLYSSHCRLNFFYIITIFVSFFLIVFTGIIYASKILIFLYALVISVSYIYKLPRKTIEN